jgi:5-methylcytosine-specific restriction endonuclease McrA
MSDVRVPLAIKRQVAERAGHRCEYCMLPELFSPAGFCIEHIMPSSGGGLSEIDNLAFACAGCNGHKADKIQEPDPITKRVVRLFHPRNDDWKRQFKWSSDGLVIEGRTAIGRTTVVALKLNRAGLTNLRRLLVREGIHPPL